MTCIVGYIDTENKEIIIGADSLGSNGYTEILRKDEKVFIKDNKFIIGFTTSYRMGQILHYMPLDVEEQTNEDDMAFMVKKFVPAVRKLFTEYWGDMKRSSGEFTGGTFLVGYKNKLYCIESDYQVGISVNNYDSVGCGSAHALGALYSMNTWCSISKEKQVITALSAAEEFSAGVRGPFIIKKMKYN